MPSPASGHIALVGFEIATPITTASPRGAATGLLIVLRVVLALAIGVSSASTLLAGLSSRSPLNDAWRTMPSPVQPANSISATNFGFNQWTLASALGAFVPLKGLALLAAAFSLACRRRVTVLPKPVPTRPT